MKNDSLLVSRELLEQLLNWDIDGIRAAMKLRAMLAAPVVERQQPFAWFTDDYLTDKSSTTYDELTSARRKAKGWSVQPLYAAPPELAELQATIAKLTAENERLKGGQGEPVAWRHTMHYGEGCGCRFELTASTESPFGKPDVDYDKAFAVTCEPLFASQPAPISAALPDPKLCSRAWGHDMGGNYDEGHSDGWNACLDKVKELNQ